MGNPKISIIVPVYNVESYLNACLDSLLKQTLQDIEIICIDDGSTDQSPRILNEVASCDSRIRILRQENAGVARARNAGLDVVRGEYVLFVDSDDYISHCACEKLYALACESNADIVVFGGKTFPTSHWADASFAQRNKTYHNNSIEALLFESGSNPLMCNKLYSAALVNGHRLRFNENLVLGEDNAFQFVSFPYASTIAYCDDKFYFYRGRPDSAVISRMEDHDKKLFLHFEIVKYIIQNWEERGIVVGCEKDLYSWVLRFLYNDASLASYNVRACFSEAFNEFFKERIRDVATFSFDPDVLERYSFMRDAQHAFEQTPKLSILLDSCDGSADVADAIKGITLQTEQAIEIAVLPARVASEPYTAMINELALADRRVHVLDSRNYQAALRSLRGDYVLYVSSGDLLEYAAGYVLFQAMEEAVKAKPGSEVSDCLDIQVVTFADSGKILRTKELYEFLVPDPSRSFSDDQVVSADTIADHIISFSSLTLSNKLVSRSYLVSLLGSDCASLYELYALALIGAQRILVTQLPLVTLAPLHFSNPESAKIATEAIVSELNNVKNLDLQTGMSVGDTVGFHVAAILFTLTYLECVSGKNSFLVAYATMYEWLAKVAPDLGDRTSDLIGVDDCNLATTIVAGDGEKAYDLVTSSLVEALIKLNRENLLAVGEQAGLAHRLSDDIKDFYESISYRAGRMVTLIPRKAVGLLKKVLKR